MSVALLEDRIARLRLIRSANIGPITYFHLLQRFGSAGRAIEAVPELAARGRGKPIKLASRADIEREMERVARLGARYLFLGQGLYPPALGEIENAPPVVIVKGHETLFDRPMVALVGARNASAAACRFARDLAARLGEREHVTVSGLARGIDTAVHAGSLQSGTIAVIAGGIDNYYPPENRELQDRIAETGLLVAEQPPGREPQARHFPYRNRIIAGMTGGTVVVEAAPRSGSLITARLAAEYGREVMAVPGSPLDSRAMGCNQLIRDGAVLVQSADDVIEAIGGFSAAAFRNDATDYRGGEPVPDASEHDRQRLVDLLGPVPVAVDELVRQSGLPPMIVQIVLLELELAGRLERHAGGRCSLSG